MHSSHLKLLTILFAFLLTLSRGDRNIGKLLEKHMFSLIMKMTLGMNIENLYFIKEVHMEGGKHLDHNIVVALCTGN